MNPREDTQGIVPLNPLAKIPTLALDDSGAIYDSPVICEYLGRVRRSAPARRVWAAAVAHAHARGARAR